MNLSSKQFTRALFDLAETANQLEKVLADLAIAYKNRYDFVLFLKNPQISNKEKIEFLINCGLESITANFILLLSQEKKFSQLPLIISGFKQLINQESNLLEVEIISKKAMANSDLEEIKSALEQKLAKNITIKNLTDRQMIAGIKIKIGDDLIDNSLENKLRQLKMQLIM